MKTKIMGIVTVVLVLGFAGTAEATIVDISVATNKPVYESGEDVVVFVIAYNPNPEPVTLTFATSMQVSYLMDNIYDWKEHHGSYQVITHQEIEPYGSHLWALTHGSDEMNTYLPSIGIHILIGEVIGYGQSATVEFEVIPEPATFVLLGIGGLLLRKRKP